MTTKWTRRELLAKLELVERVLDTLGIPNDASFELRLATLSKIVRLLDDLGVESKRWSERVKTLEARLAAIRSIAEGRCSPE